MKLCPFLWKTTTVVQHDFSGFMQKNQPATTIIPTLYEK